MTLQQESETLDCLAHAAGQCCCAQEQKDTVLNQDAVAQIAEQMFGGDDDTQAS